MGVYIKFSRPEIDTQTQCGCDGQPGAMVSV